MAQKQLSGAPAPIQDHRDRVIASLEEENAALKERVRLAERDVEIVRHENTRGVGELRRILDPLFNGLKLIYGELDAIEPANGSQLVRTDDKNNVVWDSWKKKLGGRPAEFIAELLIHGEMTGKQLEVATRCGRKTVAGTIYKLNQAQLINKNGGKYSLKEL